MTVKRPAQPPAEEGLGFDPLAFLRGFILWWKFLVLLVAVAAATGVIAGLVFGWRVYEAETILQYKSVGPPPAVGETTFILTQLNLVKLPSNLEETRTRLGLPITLSRLGSAIEAKAQRNTTLMSIKAVWDDPATAAAIVNTIRDVFLENGRRTRKLESRKTLNDLTLRLSEVRKKLLEGEQALASFTTGNNVVDLDKEAQWYLEQLTSMDLLFEQAQIEKRTIDLQVANLDRIINELKARVAEEKKHSSSVDNLGDLNIKVERLRDAIHQDKQYRAGMAELTQREHEYQQAKALFARKLIAAAEVEKAKNAYERQKALTVDTEQTKSWKAEVERLNKQVIPPKGDDGPSGPLLREMMLKSFNLSLQEVAVSDKVKSMEDARQKVKAKLDSLPRLQREFVILTREVSAFETEKKKLEDEIARVRTVVESEDFDFSIISHGTPPKLPLRSNRKILALGAGGGVFVLGVILVFLVELVDTSIRSGKDLTAKLRLPLLAALPHFSEGTGLFPDSPQNPLLEAFRILAHRIRSAVPKRGAKILVVSACHDEGRTVTASNLAACLGRSDENVLLIDAQIRDVASSADLRRFLASDDLHGKGLGEYLSFAVSDVQDVVAPTVLAGVSCIPRVGAAVIPDLLASNRMREMLDELCVRYSVILIDAPPLLPYVDAAVLAKQADAAIFVVRSRRGSTGNLQTAVTRLKETGIPILGAVLTDFDPIFREEEV